MFQFYETETWLRSASSCLLFFGVFANLFSLAAVRNAAKADINQPHKAYVRHTNYMQHASDAFLNFLTIPLIHFFGPVLALHVQAIPSAVVIWMQVLRSISRTASLAGPFACFKLTSVYKGSMVTMVYISSFLVALYATTFNYIIFIHIFHDFQDKMVWMSWMMAVQGWILPGVILLFSNIAYLVAIWLNERQNKKSGLVAPSGWKLWIAAYGFLITLLFISSTAGSMLAHPIHQEVLSESNLTATSSKTLSNLTSLHSILLNTLLSILNPLLSFICLEKYRGNCVDLMNLWQRKVINYFN